jgi:hypothetical protein
MTASLTNPPCGGAARSPANIDAACIDNQERKGSDMKIIGTMLLGAALLPLSAHAETSFDYAAGYYLHSSQDRNGSNDGNGWGARASGKIIDRAFVFGEYQSASFDSDGGGHDVSFIRGGAGFILSETEQASVSLSGEYLSNDRDVGAKLTGWGGHIGAVLHSMDEIDFYGEVGYLDLDEFDGPEYLLGGAFRFAPQWAVTADYRISDFGGDAGDLKYSDLHAGVRYNFAVK